MTSAHRAALIVSMGLVIVLGITSIVEGVLGPILIALGGAWALLYFSQ